MNLMQIAVPFQFELVTEVAADTPTGSKGFTFSGHGSSWKKDLGSNVLLKGAFKDTLAARLPNKMIKVRWMHNDPMGYLIDAKEDNQGLWVKGFVPDTATNRERVQLMQAGVVDKMSIGFDPIASSIEYTSNERRIGKVTLFEVSPVDLPLNEDTGTDTIEAFSQRAYYSFGNGMRTIIRPREQKSVTVSLDIGFADLTTSWDTPTALVNVAAFYKVTDTTNADYDKCFVWVPDDTADTDPAHRQLLLVDITNAQNPASGAIGVPMLIPAAVEEAAMIVQEGSDNNDVTNNMGIPVAQLQACKDLIDGYYAKMQAAFSDPTLVSPWDASIANNENTGDTTLGNKNKGKVIKPVETFVGATISASNMALLATAMKNIQTVIASAATGASNGTIEKQANEWEGFASLDWESTINNLKELNGG